MCFSLSLQQKLSLIFSALLTVLPAVINGYEYSFLPSPYVFIYVPVYLEKYFENKGVFYNLSLGGDMWNCKWYLLFVSSLRAIYKDHVYPVVFKLLQCILNATVPKEDGKDTLKHRNPNNNIDGIRPWSDNILDTCLALFHLLIENGGLCCYLA